MTKNSLTYIAVPADCWVADRSCRNLKRLPVKNPTHVPWPKEERGLGILSPKFPVSGTPTGKQVWGEEAKGDPMAAKIPLGMYRETVEVADLALFLSSPASGLINGKTIMIHGGYVAI